MLLMKRVEGWHGDKTAGLHRTAERAAGGGGVLKISDILKKTRRLEPAAVPSTATPIPAPITINSPVVPEPSAAQQPSAAPVAAPVAPEPSPSDRIAAAQLYQHAVTATRPLMTPYASEAHLQKAREFVDVVTQQLKARNEGLVEVFFDDYPADAHYLANHAVNVCILSLALARELPYDAAQLKKLGLAALLHDIGLAKFEDIIARPEQLKERDIIEVRKHPLLGKDLAAKLAGELDFEVFDVIQQEHERVDGSGYPFGLKDNEISEFAKLVAVADVYEALTHARPYRSRYDGRAAVRLMLEQKQSFSQRCLKALINTLGIFPVGTLVELNTHETGIVLRQTKSMPLRPVILITHNAQQQKLAEEKRIDLARNFSVYIKECVK